MTINAFSLSTATKKPLTAPTANAASRAAAIAAHILSSCPPETPKSMVLESAIIDGGDKSIPRLMMTIVCPMVAHVRNAANGRMDRSVASSRSGEEAGGR